MNINPITFGKTYISKAYARNNIENKKEEFDFVEYDDFEKDKKTLLKTAVRWEPDESDDVMTAMDVYSQFATHKNKNHRHYYGLENQEGEIEVLVETIEGDKKFTHPNLKYGKEPLEVALMMTNPRNQHILPLKKYSKLGISAFREIINEAKKKGFDYITLTDMSRGFWSNIPFMTTQRDKLGFETKYLKQDDYDHCISRIDEMI